MVWIQSSQSSPRILGLTCFLDVLRAERAVPGGCSDSPEAHLATGRGGRAERYIGVGDFMGAESPGRLATGKTRENNYCRLGPHPQGDPSSPGRSLVMWFPTPLEQEQGSCRIASYAPHMPTPLSTKPSGQGGSSDQCQMISGTKPQLSADLGGRVLVTLERTSRPQLCFSPRPGEAAKPDEASSRLPEDQLRRVTTPCVALTNQQRPRP